jgi:hypothetical protein
MKQRGKEYWMTFENKDLEKEFMEWNHQRFVFSTRVAMGIGFIFSLYHALVNVS